MGVYVYTLRAQKKTIEIDGVKHVAHLLKYAFKPYLDGNEPAKFKAMIMRAVMYWANRPNGTPKIVVFGEFEEGATVVADWPLGLTDCYDSAIPGRIIGTLTKVGKKLIVTTEQNI